MNNLSFSATKDDSKSRKMSCHEAIPIEMKKSRDFVVENEELFTGDKDFVGFVFLVKSFVDESRYDEKFEIVLVHRITEKSFSKFGDSLENLDNALISHLKKNYPKKIEKSQPENSCSFVFGRSDPPLPVSNSNSNSKTTDSGKFYFGRKVEDEEIKNIEEKEKKNEEKKEIKENKPQPGPQFAF